jgi:ferric-dicitrate binding protein FerR (iron transport regulator)
MSAIICGGVFACSFAAADFRDHVGVFISTGWQELRGLTGFAPLKETLVGPGEQLSLAGSRVTVVKVSPEELVERLSWATVQQNDGWLVFHGETVQQAAEAFNRYNERQLLAGDVKTARLRVGGKFRTTDLEGFVAALEVTHRVRVARVPAGGDGHEVILLTGSPP